MKNDSKRQVMQCMEVWGGNAATSRNSRMPGLDIWVYSQPHEQSNVGGDIHYVSSCATGRITRLLLADVSGHGAGVAEVAVSLRDLMRRHINYVDLTRFVSELNQEFKAISASGCFATAVVLTYVIPRHELHICNAGHPAPLIYRQATEQWSMLESAARDPDALNNIPLGLLEETSYDQFETTLEPGDQVMCYTDALMESRNAAGQMLGQQGMVEAMSHVDASKPSQIIDQTLNHVSSLQSGNLAGDDVSMLLLKAMKESLPWHAYAKAPFYVLSDLIGLRKTKLTHG